MDRRRDGHTRFSFHLISFFPPTGIAHSSTPIYVLVMVVGILLCSIPPFLADIFKKPSWRGVHPDPVLLDVSEELAGRLGEILVPGASLMASINDNSATRTASRPREELRPCIEQ